MQLRQLPRTSVYTELLAEVRWFTTLGTDKGTQLDEIQLQERNDLVYVPLRAMHSPVQLGIHPNTHIPLRTQDEDIPKIDTRHLVLHLPDLYQWTRQRDELAAMEVPPLVPLQAQEA